MDEKNDRDELARAAVDVTRWIAQQGHPGALIGGLAVSMLVETRSTQDVDAIFYKEEPITPDIVDSLASCGLRPRYEGQGFVDFATDATSCCWNMWRRCVRSICRWA